MKLTKYEHSCIDITHNNERILIDPGIFTLSIPDYKNISAVIVTHQHPDHLDIEKLQTIHQENPQLQIISTQDVVAKLNDVNLPAHAVTDGDRKTVGAFDLRFSGDQHAVIHASIPVVQNICVTINNTLYLPGDSLKVPSHEVAVLGVPIAAPWMRLMEAMDFIEAIKPKQVIPVHEAVLSEAGFGIHSSRLEQSSQNVGARYTPLKTGESIDI